MFLIITFSITLSFPVYYSYLFPALTIGSHLNLSNPPTVQLLNVLKTMMVILLFTIKENFLYESDSSLVFSYVFYEFFHI